MAPALVATTPSKSRLGLFEKPVEHAPGEGAMGAAALKGEIEGLDIAALQRSLRRAPFALAIVWCMVMRFPPFVFSVGRPAAIDRQGCAGDRLAALAA